MRALLRHIEARVIFWSGAVVVGLVAVLFAELSERAQSLFQSGLSDYPWLPFIVTPLAGFVVAWAMRQYFPGSNGSGIPQVMAELERRPEDKWPPLVSLRLAFGKVVLGVAAIGAGFSFGREGPTVQVGASIMAALSRYLPRAANIKRTHLLVVGSGAGIAAAFNTPLAGIVFAIEELNRKVESRVSALIITAIMLAGFIARAVLGNTSYFGEMQFRIYTSTAIQVILLSSVTTGLLGGLFARVLILSATNWNTPLGRWREQHPYRFAAACGLLIAALGWACGGITYGTGYRETISLLTDVNVDLPWYYGPAKLIATVVSYASGLPGGIFAPSLAIGAGFGHSLDLLLDDYAPSEMILIFCMVGFLAAATQAPLTAIFIVMEMVDGYRMVLGLMATALLASAISKLLSGSLYSVLAANILQSKRQHTAAQLPDTAQPHSRAQP